MKKPQIDILEDLYDTLVGNTHFLTLYDFQTRYLSDNTFIDYDQGIIDLGNGFYIKVGKFIQ